MYNRHRKSRSKYSCFSFYSPLIAHFMKSCIIALACFFFCSIVSVLCLKSLILYSYLTKSLIQNLLVSWIPQSRQPATIATSSKSHASQFQPKSPSPCPQTGKNDNSFHCCGTMIICLATRCNSFLVTFLLIIPPKN